MSLIALLSALATAPFVVIALLKITLLLAASAAIIALVPRAFPVERHLIWTAGLCGTLLIPVVMSVVPPWPLPMLPRVENQSPENQWTAKSPCITLPCPPSAPVLDAQFAERLATSDGSTTPFTVQASSPSTSLSTSSWLLLIWLLGVFGLLTRAAIGYVGLHRLRKRASPLDAAEWQHTLANECERAGIHHTVDLRTSSDVYTPITWGIRTPIVIIPTLAVSSSEDERTIILRHELAHVARRDLTVQAVITLVTTVLWFHPLVWYAAHRQRIECEHACDAQVLSYGTSGPAYATQLLENAKAMRDVGSRAHVSFAMAFPSYLEGRLIAILNAYAHYIPMSKRTIISVAAPALMAVLTISACHPVTRYSPVLVPEENPRVVDRTTDTASASNATIVDTPRSVRTEPARTDTHVFVDSTRTSVRTVSQVDSAVMVDTAAMVTPAPANESIRTMSWNDTTAVADTALAMSAQASDSIRTMSSDTAAVMDSTAATARPMAVAASVDSAPASPQRKAKQNKAHKKTPATAHPNKPGLSVTRPKP